MMKVSKSTPTIQDVAQAAGVSVSTVSRVLNDKDDVSLETYEKVQRVISELGYASSLAARSMRSHKTNVIGLTVVNLTDSFSVELIKGIGRAIQKFDYDLIAYSSGRSTTTPESAWEREHVMQLNGSITDGMIVVTPTTTNLPRTHPLVVIDPFIEDHSFPAVISTNRIGALSAMEYLIGLGHRRIGFIGGRTDLQSAIRRRLGYEDGLRQAGLPIDPELIQEGDFSRQLGFTCTQKLLGLPNRPTAIFASNDQSALGAIDAATQAGLGVPEDLSIMGFDNIPEASYILPALTTIDQSIEEMGYVATELLIKLIQGQPLNQQVYKVGTKLVVRESCRALA